MKIRMIYKKLDTDLESACIDSISQNKFHWNRLDICYFEYNINVDHRDINLFHK